MGLEEERSEEYECEEAEMGSGNKLSAS